MESIIIINAAIATIVVTLNRFVSEDVHPVVEVFLMVGIRVPVKSTIVITALITPYMSACISFCSPPCVSGKAYRLIYF